MATFDGKFIIVDGIASFAELASGNSDDGDNATTSNENPLTTVNGAGGITFSVSGTLTIDEGNDGTVTEGVDTIDGSLIVDIVGLGSNRVAGSKEITIGGTTFEIEDGLLGYQLADGRFLLGVFTGGIGNTTSPNQAIEDALEANALQIDSLTVGFANVDATENGIPESYLLDVVCFCTGTRIMGAFGEVPVETLKPGELLLTKDRDLQPIRWIASRKFDSIDLRRNPKLRPVRIKVGSLGENLPKHDLLVSRQHRFLVDSEIAKRMFGTSEVLVSAIKLTELPGIFIDENIESVEYFHVLLEQHEIIYANGSLAETLLTGTEALKAVSRESREEILAIFPELARTDYSPDTVRLVPTARHQKKLAARHAKNNKPVTRDRCSGESC